MTKTNPLNIICMLGLYEILPLAGQRNKSSNLKKLENVFLKHYAPTICLILNAQITEEHGLF